MPLFLCQGMIGGDDGKYDFALITKRTVKVKAQQANRIFEQKGPTQLPKLGVRMTFGHHLTQ